MNIKSFFKQSLSISIQFIAAVVVVICIGNYFLPSATADTDSDIKKNTNICLSILKNPTAKYNSIENSCEIFDENGEKSDAVGF
jgi:hypothetical protein